LRKNKVMSFNSTKGIVIYMHVDNLKRAKDKTSVPDMQKIGGSIPSITTIQIGT